MGGCRSGSLQAAEVPCRSGRSQHGPLDLRCLCGPDPASRQLDRLARHVGFRQPAALGELFHDVAIAITCGKIHSAVYARPGPGATSARRRSWSRRTRASPSPRNRRLPMLLLIETWSAACCWFSDCTNCSIVRPDSDESLLDPGQRQCQSGALSLQPARKFRDKGARPAAGSSAPCRRSPESGSSDPSRQSPSSGPPR